MTKDEIRIEVAKALGWEVEAYDSGMCFMPDGSRVPMSLMPDFVSDLNACHEMEKTLDMNQLYDYGENLARLVQRAEIELEKSLGFRKTNDNSLFIPNGHGWFAIASATALQRCEAFLRTLNLWKE